MKLKNILISTTALIIGSIALLTSCNKENTSTINDPIYDEYIIAKAINTNDTLVTTFKTLTKFEMLPEPHCTNHTPGNCLEEVVVWGERIIKDIINPIQQDPSMAPKLFQKEHTYLSQFFDERIIQSVINQKLDVEILGNTQTDKTIHVLFKQGKTLRLVQPMVIK